MAKAEKAEDLVIIEKVTKSYGELHALKDVNLKIEKGEFVAIMGPSGSGKSTMLNMIGCMDKPTTGRIVIDDVDVTAVNPQKLTEIRRDKIGLVFQQFHLVPYLTALENVMLAQYYHSMPDATEAKEALDKVGLGARVNHLPKELSGGEQQRVCVARALINHPALVLADEPTGNLDEANEEIVMDIFKKLHSEGHTIVMVTHDVEMGELAQRRIYLEHGNVITPQHFASHHSHLVKN